MTNEKKRKNNHPPSFITFRVMNLQNYRKYDIFLKLPDFFNIFKISWLHISGTNKDKRLIVFLFCSF